MIEELKRSVEQTKTARKNEEILLGIQSSIASLSEATKSVEDKIQPPVSEVSVKNLHDPVKEVTVTNLKDFPADIKVSNLGDIKIPEQKEEISIKKASWLEKSISDLGDKVKKEVTQLKAKITDSFNLDKYTKKSSPLAVRLVTEDGRDFYNAGGGGNGGGPDIVGLKDSTNTVINPATSDNQTNGLQKFRIADSSNLDAFGRLRTSNPVTLFDSQLQYGKKTWSASLYDTWEETVSGAGSVVTHLPNESACNLTVGTVSGEKTVRQQHIYNRYQPGKSQLIFMTGTMFPKTSVRQRLGYFDVNDGIFFESTSTPEFNFVLRTSTSGTVSDANSVAKANWNIDTFDGTGPSGITIDFTKSQIWFFDLEWLSIGRVRCGFVMNGTLLYAHSFNNANTLSVPYMKTANLPCRYEIENTGTSESTTSLKQICASVISEGGFEVERGDASAAYNDGTAVAVDTTFRPVLCLRPKTTFNSINNTGFIEPMEVHISTITNDIDWLVYINPTFTGGAHSWVSSGVTKIMEYDVTRTGTAMTLSNGSIEMSGESVAAGGAAARVISADAFQNRLLLGNNINFTSSDVFVVAAKARTGTANVRAVVDCREFK